LPNNSISAEATLWTYLKNRQLEGHKFRRQHSIGNFIADFYCTEAQLVIELDGEDHFWEEGIQSDNNKSNYLHQLGIQVIRFENKWMFEDVAYVLNKIKTYLTANMIG
jgi:very-short-patch-repair endonuclease